MGIGTDGTAAVSVVVAVFWAVSALLLHAAVVQSNRAGKIYLFNFMLKYKSMEQYPKNSDFEEIETEY